MQAQTALVFISSVNPFKMLMLEGAQYQRESWGLVGGRHRSHRCPQCAQAQPLTHALWGGLGSLGCVCACKFLLGADSFAEPQMKGRPQAIALAPGASGIHSDRLFLGKGDKSLREAIFSAAPPPRCSEHWLPWDLVHSKFKRTLF